MNKTIMFIQADMHRSINAGRDSVVVSVLDLKELLAAVMSSEAKEISANAGHGVGYINGDKLKELLSGKRFYGTIRRKKSDECGERLYCRTELLVEAEEGIIDPA